MINRLDAWHKTVAGLLVFAVLELALCYAFASLAIDRGNLWYYLFAVILIIGGIQNLIRFSVVLTRKVRHG